MKKVLLLSVCTILLVSSCGTYAGDGAYTGSVLGSVLGSAIGGISGGPRGSDIGTIAGMAGGAIIGGAIGSAADKARQNDCGDIYSRRRQDAVSRRQPAGSDIYYGNEGDSGFDPDNGGDDRLDWDASLSAPQPSSGIVIRNVCFVDDNNDGMLCSGETGKVVFEVMNYTSHPLYNVRPSVVEATGNRHIYVSQGICVEKIAPGKGIRYTAMIKGDSRLKDGKARFLLSVSHDGNSGDTITEELGVRTLKD